MRSSSSMSTIFQTCIILTLAIASEASRFKDSPASITPPPGAATIRARTFGEVVAGPCGPFDRYAPAGKGATCTSLADSNDITIDEFLLMNPGINSDCSNLVAGNSYCVGSLGSEADPAPVLTCSEISDDNGGSLCSCNNNKYYGLMPNPGTAGPCAWGNQVLPLTLPSPTTLPPSPTPTRSTESPHTTITRSPVYKDVCLTTPGTCFSGPTGTDKISYTLGCCNGCGPGGSCDLNGPPAGPMTYQCNCGEVMRRQAFNGLIGNTTWTA